jgi:hypothetical protein
MLYGVPEVLPGFLARSYNLAPPSPPPSRHQVDFFSQSSCVSPVELDDRRGGREKGGGAKSDDVKKAWLSINHSILSGSIPWRWSHLCLNSSIVCFQRVKKVATEHYCAQVDYTCRIY